MEDRLVILSSNLGIGNANIAPVHTLYSDPDGTLRLVKDVGGDFTFAIAGAANVQSQFTVGNVFVSNTYNANTVITGNLAVGNLATRDTLTVNSLDPHVGVKGTFGVTNVFSVSNVVAVNSDFVVLADDAHSLVYADASANAVTVIGNIVVPAPGVVRANLVGNVASALVTGNLQGAFASFTSNVRAPSVFGNLVGQSVTVDSVSTSLVTANVQGAFANLTSNVRAPSVFGNVIGQTVTVDSISTSLVTANVQGAFANLSSNVRAPSIFGNVVGQTATVTTLFGNLAGQTATVNTVFGNLAGQSATVDTVTANLQGVFATLTSNVRAPSVFGNLTGQTATVTTVFGNLAGQTATVNTLFGNVQGHTAIATANVQTPVVYGNLAGQTATVDTVTANVQGAFATLTSNVRAPSVFGNVVGQTATVTTVLGNLAGQTATVNTVFGNLAGQTVTVDTATATTVLGNLQGVFATLTSNIRAPSVFGNLTGQTATVTLLVGNLAGQSATVNTLFGNLAGQTVTVDTATATSVLGNLQGAFANLTSNVRAPGIYGNLAGQTATVTTVFGNLAGQTSTVNTVFGNLEGQTAIATANMRTPVLYGNVYGQSVTVDSLVTPSLYGNLDTSFLTGNIDADFLVDIRDFLPEYGGLYTLGNAVNTWAAVYADTFIGNAAGLTGLNASNIVSGTISNSFLPSNLSVSNISANGSALSGLNASNLVSGTVSNSLLPASISVSNIAGNGAALSGLNASNLVTGTVSNSLLPASISVSNIAANGAALSGLNASNLVSGTVSNSLLPASISVSNIAANGSALSGLNASNITTGTLQNARLPASISVTDISANGVALSGLNASNITTGTLQNARLPASIAVTDISGNGAGLSNLNASNLSTGTVSNSLLPASISISNISANGAALSGLNASNITAGTLDNARLPASISVSNVSGNGSGLSSINLANTYGTLAVLQGGTGVTTSTGTGSVVLNVAPILAGTTLLDAAYVKGNLRVSGNLMIDSGNVTYVDSQVIVSNQMTITNDGTGPALIARQNGAESVAEFKDDANVVFKLYDSGYAAFAFGNSSALASGTPPSGNLVTILGSLSANLSANDVVAGTLQNARLPASISVTDIAANGVALSGLNASNITTGTLDNARLPSSISVSNVAANGLGLSGLNASNITTGTLDNARLPASISVTDIAANGLGLSGLNASNVTTGTLDNARLPASISVTDIAANGLGLSGLNASNVTTGTLDNARLPSSIAVTNIAANGLGLSGLNASNITTGTLDTARLPSSISVAGNVQAAYFIGNGAFLSGVVTGGSGFDGNASNITSGTLDTARLPSNISTGNLTATGNVSATYVLGNGAFLTGVVTGSGFDGNASNITSGTLSNARLPSVISVSNISANGYALSAINAANIVGTLDLDVLVAPGSIDAGTDLGGTLAANLFPANLFISNISSANAYGLSAINAANVVGNLTDLELDFGVGSVPGNALYGDLNADIVLTPGSVDASVNIANIGNWIPAAANTYTLGNAAYPWKDLILGNSAVIAGNTISQGFLGSYKHKNLILNGELKIPYGNLLNLSTDTTTFQQAVWFYSSTRGFSSTATRSTVLGTDTLLYNAGLRYYMTITRGAANVVDWYWATTVKIPGSQLYELDWGTSTAKAVTLSFYYKSNVAGNHYVFLKNGDWSSSSTNIYCATFNVPTIDTWTKIVLNIPGPTAGTWSTAANPAITLVFLNRPRYTGTSLSVNNAWTTSNANFKDDVPAAGITVVDFNSSSTNYISYTGVQLEIGTVADPQFEFRSPAADYSMSQTLGNAVFVSDSDNVCIRSRLGIGIIPGTQLDLSTDSARKLTTTTWATGSDERIKEDIELANLDVCYETVKSIPLKRFAWKESYAPTDVQDDRRQLGFIAQDVESVVPKAVSRSAEHGFEDFRTLNTDQLLKASWGALQRIMQKLEALETSQLSADS